MKPFFKCLLAVFVLFLTVTYASADTIPAPSFWKNQRGSELKIWSVNNGVIQGEFTNNSPKFDCQGITYPVNGRETATGFFFVVMFAKCNSFTRWQGHVRGSQMITTWKLYYVKPDGTIGVLPGSDAFQRVN